MGHTLAQLEMMRLQDARPRPWPPVDQIRDRTLPAPRLVEFRCRGGKPYAGHLLAVIYRTPRGPLAVSTADDAFDDMPARNKRVREWAAEQPRLHFDPKRLPWQPNPRLLEVDEPFADDPMPINCRCGPWPDLTRAALRAAAALYHRGAPVVIGVSHSGLHGPGDTLCVQF
jgi:hypothetical protein